MPVPILCRYCDNLFHRIKPCSICRYMNISDKQLIIPNTRYKYQNK